MTLRYGLNEEQALIADGAQAVFADHFPAEAIRKYLNAGRVTDEAREALAGSGILGVCAPTEVGGVGLGASDALPILMAAGRYIVPWPVADSIVAASLLAAKRPEIARSVLAARDIVAFAPAAKIGVVADGKRWRLQGTFEAVPWSTQADWLIAEFDMPARQLAVIDLQAAGIAREARKSIDPCCPMARVQLQDVVIDADNLIGAADGRSGNLRALLSAAEMVGAAQRCLDMAVDYMKVRKQFGQVIGRFQALKHIAANDALYLESMRLSIEYAAWAYDARAEDAQTALHIALQYCSQQARTVAEDAIQCHGGIGFTWDYDLHLYLRRILRLGVSHGTASEHRETLAAAVIEELSRSP